MLFHSTKLQYSLSPSQWFNLPCVEQGVSFKHTQFISNRADANGGAIATPDTFKKKP